MYKGYALAFFYYTYITKVIVLHVEVSIVQMDIEALKKKTARIFFAKMTQYYRDNL